LKDWRFSPALRDGLPDSAVAEIQVPFGIENLLPSLDAQRRYLELFSRLREQGLLKPPGAQK
jgi:hypothetical protein